MTSVLLQALSLLLAATGWAQGQREVGAPASAPQEACYENPLTPTEAVINYTVSAGPATTTYAFLVRALSVML